MVRVVMKMQISLHPVIKLCKVSKKAFVFRFTCVVDLDLLFLSLTGWCDGVFCFYMTSSIDYLLTECEVYMGKYLPEVFLDTERRINEVCAVKTKGKSFSYRVNKRS